MNVCLDVAGTTNTGRVRGGYRQTYPFLATAELLGLPLGGDGSRSHSTPRSLPFGGANVDLSLRGERVVLASGKRRTIFLGQNDSYNCDHFQGRI